MEAARTTTGRCRGCPHQCQVTPSPSWNVLALPPSKSPQPNEPYGLMEKLLPVRMSYPNPAVAPRPVEPALIEQPSTEAPTSRREKPTPPRRKKPEVDTG